MAGGKVLEEEVLVESGTNMSIGCPGLTRNTFVVQLEWRCSSGRCGSQSKIVTSNKGSAEHGLLKYVKDQGTTVFKSKKRLRLEDDKAGMFSLAFSPVRAEDEGSYTCLINNRPNPDAVIKLKVLGESRRNCAFFFTSLQDH